MWNPFARTGSTAVSKRKPSPPDYEDTEVQRIDVVDHQQREIAQIEVIDGVGVVTLITEELSSLQGAEMLADLLDQVVESGVDHIVLDIQNVLFMDSACVGCMVEALNRMASSGGRIALVNPGSSVAHIFRITRLDRVFPICSDVLAAMNAVRRQEGDTAQ